MKRMILTALTALLVFAITAQAADIFGEDREFSLTYGDDLAVGHYGFQPLGVEQPFSWGFTVSSLFDRAEVDDSVQATEWYAGVYVEHAILTFTGVDVLLPDGAGGEVFGGAEMQYRFSTNQDIYFTPYVGVEFNVSDDVLIRTAYRYNKRDTMLDEHVLSIGVKVEW